MKAVLRIFNLLYIALAAVACVALLTRPIVRIDATVRLPKEEAAKVLEENIGAEDLTRADYEKALEPSLDKDGYFIIPLENINVPAAYTISKDASEITNVLTKQVQENVDKIVKSLTPTIKELAKLMAKSAGKSAIKDSISQQIKGTSSESSEQIMERCGINDQYIENMTDNVMDNLLGNPSKGIEPVKNVDELMSTISGNVNEVCHKLANGDVEGFPKDETELQSKISAMNNDIEKQLKDQLLEAKLCDEQGNITDIEKVVDEFLADAIQKIIDEGNKETRAKPILRADASSQEEQESKLAIKIRELLNQQIEKFNINGIVEQYWFIPLLMTLGLMLPWLIFILITIIRSLRKGKIWTKSWVVFVFAAIQVITGIAIYLLTARFMSQFLEILPIPDNPTTEIIKASTLTVETSAFIPSILYLVMIPLTIAYMIIAHKVKKQYKADKKEKKAAKKAAKAA